MSFELIVKNFLSLYEIDISFSGINVLIGPNASGKSNIIRALELISKFTREGIAALTDIFSNKSFVDATFRGQGGNIEFEIKWSEFQYKLRIGLDLLFEEVCKNTKTIFKREATNTKEEITYTAMNGTLKTIRRAFAPTSMWQISTPLLKIVGFGVSNDLKKFIDFICSMRTFAFIPEKIKEKSSIHGAIHLGRRGENLARVLLHHYLEKREFFSRLENMFRSLIPDVNEIVPVLRDGYVWIAFREKYSDMLIRPEFLSDGSLRILALLVSLLRDGDVIAYEEPENFVHPHLLESIIDIIRKTNKTVIMTTHSPYLLDHVKPEEVILVTKTDGKTVARRLSAVDEVKAVRKYLEEGGTLGEAWFSGLIGDV